MAKQKYNFNGTLLNLLLLGGAAVILKKRTGSLRGVGAINNPTSTSILISGSRRLAADAFFCFEKYTTYKRDQRGNASTLILSYPTESKAREELNKGMQYLISSYPNYKVEEVKYTGNTKVFYVIDPITNERISIYIY